MVSIGFRKKGEINVCLTCIGVLAEDKAVKPTISLKKIVTCGNVSGATVPPRFNSSATDLKNTHLSDLLISFESKGVQFSHT